MLRLLCVSLSIFASAVMPGARADDFPITKFSPFTYVVDYEASWSPDSRQIVLISSRHGGMKVHVMKADSTSHGSDMRQLTSGSDEDDSPAWSPDGKKIAFVAIKAGVSQIVVMNADGTNQVPLTNWTASDNAEPSWSGDGARIVFTSSPVGIGAQIYNLWVIKSDGTELTPATAGTASSSYSAQWYPENQHIVFGSNRRLDGVDVVSTGNIWILDVASGAASPLTTATTEADSVGPIW